MSLWSRLFGSRKETESAAPPQPQEDQPRDTSKTIELPVEPYVFECQSCGKVFEARRRRANCPECDSPDVAIVSE